MNEPLDYADPFGPFDPEPDRREEQRREMEVERWVEEQAEGQEAEREESAMRTERLPEYLRRERALKARLARMTTDEMRAEYWRLQAEAEAMDQETYEGLAGDQLNATQTELQRQVGEALGDPCWQDREAHERRMQELAQ